MILVRTCDASRHSYSGLQISGRRVSFSVAGKGCDTPQLYLSYPAAATDPAVPVPSPRSPSRPPSCHRAVVMESTAARPCARAATAPPHRTVHAVR